RASIISRRCRGLRASFAAEKLTRRLAIFPSIATPGPTPLHPCESLDGSQREFLRHACCFGGRGNHDAKQARYSKRNTGGASVLDSRTPPLAVLFRLRGAPPLVV